MRFFEITDGHAINLDLVTHIQRIDDAVYVWFVGTHEPLVLARNAYWEMRSRLRSWIPRDEQILEQLEIIAKHLDTIAGATAAAAAGAWGRAMSAEPLTEVRP